MLSSKFLRRLLIVMVGVMFVGACASRTPALEFDLLSIMRAYSSSDAIELASSYYMMNGCYDKIGDDEEWVYNLFRKMVSDGLSSNQVEVARAAATTFIGYRRFLEDEELMEKLGRAMEFVNDSYGYEHLFIDRNPDTGEQYLLIRIVKH